MKKFYVVLALAKTRNTSKLALARMLIDILDLKELYEPLNYRGTFDDLEKLNDADYFDVLEIDSKESAEKLEDIEIDNLRNYDVALALATAGNIFDAENIMESFNVIPEYNDLKEPLDVKRFEDIDKVNKLTERASETYRKLAEANKNVHSQPDNLLSCKRPVTWKKEMSVRWQDEVKWLYNLVYAPEKERWEQSKKVEIGFSHWYAYLSKYAELRRKETMASF